MAKAPAASLSIRVHVSLRLRKTAARWATAEINCRHGTPSVCGTFPNSFFAALTAACVFVAAIGRSFCGAPIGFPAPIPNATDPAARGRAAKVDSVA